MNKVPGAKDKISCNKTVLGIIYDNIGINSIKSKSCMQKLQQKRFIELGLEAYVISPATTLNNSTP